jgi:hypothetical protein
MTNLSFIQNRFFVAKNAKNQRSTLGNGHILCPFPYKLTNSCIFLDRRQHISQSHGRFYWIKFDISQANLSS